MKKRLNEKSGKYPIRVAVVMGQHVTGGIKSVIMNYYKHINRDVIQFDFLVNDTSPIKDYSEIEELGGKVYEVPSINHPIKNILACRKIFKQEKYLIVHGYLNTLNVFPMFAAKLAGVPVRIAENLSTAHASEKRTAIKNVLKPFAKLFPTHLAANSKYAAEWLYGKKELDNCKIIYNALDLEIYRYDEEIRKELRRKMNLDGCFVLGHIGRYHYQKNHEFLIDIFNEVYKRDKSARLLLIGYGHLKESIFDKINRLGLNEVVIDCGATEDIMPFYNAMDCFVLPSFYEGLPVVGIEAQATGLPCVFSTEITFEAKITDCVQYISLNETAMSWADVVFRYKGYIRCDGKNYVTEAGYNIRKEAIKLQEYYIECLKHNSLL